MNKSNDTLAPEFRPIVDAIEEHLIGKRHIITLTLAAFFARGHLLLEDIPGVGKTTLAKQFASVMNLSFGRIQFTSDMLPSDILGVSYYSQKEGDFIFKRGPIFTRFLLADEINRTMPKTQSALLEAMEEGHVTVDGMTYDLEQPFFVIATQNPHEEVGTFSLPLSQLDRFICSFGIGYPDAASERRILLGEAKRSGDTKVEPLDLENCFARVEKVYLSDTILDYLQAIIRYTRESGEFEYGLSTRGALALVGMLKSWAMLHGRDYATADDLQAVTVAVCFHRLRFLQGKTTASRLEDVLFSNIRSDS